GDFPDEMIRVIRPHPERPGALAAVTQLADDRGCGVRLSFDCGETWSTTERYSTAFEIHDLAWLERNTHSVLILATDRGLFEIVLEADSGPVPVPVDASDPDLGFYAVT